MFLIQISEIGIGAEWCGEMVNHCALVKSTIFIKGCLV